MAAAVGPCPVLLQPGIPGAAVAHVSAACAGTKLAGAKSSFIAVVTTAVDVIPFLKRGSTLKLCCGRAGGFRRVEL